jgi:hypothetical protein
MQLLDSEEDSSEWVKNKKKFWATDPVHMTADGYAELVRVLANAAVNAEYDRVKEPVAAPAQRRRPPKIYKRQGWVSSDDTTAHRVYPQEAKWPHRGGQRGHYGTRGHRGQQRGGYRGRGNQRGGGDRGFRSWLY